MPKYYNAEDVDAIFEKLEDDYSGTSFIAGIYTAHNCICNIPTADVEPIVHAHWERKAYFPDGTPVWVCSRWGHPEKVKYSHCNCGARMEEEKCLWREGTLQVGKSLFHYWYKQYDEGSEYGIDGGRISKLMLQRNGKTVCNYDRGWDIKPTDPDMETALKILLSNN